jgi:hypothetical protein
MPFVQHSRLASRPHGCTTVWDFPLERAEGVGIRQAEAFKAGSGFAACCLISESSFSAALQVNSISDWRSQQAGDHGKAQVSGATS